MEKAGIFKSMQKSLRNFFIEETGPFKSGQKFLRKNKDHPIAILITRIMIAFFITKFIFAIGLIGLALKSFVIFTILGGILSFFFMQIGQFFLQNFLEKKANHEDFSYVKEIISIIFGELFVSLFLPSILALLLIDHFGMKEALLVWIFYVSLLLGILIFSYRLGPLKMKLLDLQEKYKNKEND